jgi:hypothetical protein
MGKVQGGEGEGEIDKRSEGMMVDWLVSAIRARTSIRTATA